MGDIKDYPFGVCTCLLFYIFRSEDFLQLSALCNTVQRIHLSEHPKPIQLMSCDVTLSSSSTFSDGCHSVYCVRVKTQTFCLSRLPVPFHPTLSRHSFFSQSDCPFSCYFYIFNPAFDREFPSYRSLSNSLHSWLGFCHCWGSSGLQKASVVRSGSWGQPTSFICPVVIQCDWWTKRGSGAKEGKRRRKIKEKRWCECAVMWKNHVPKIELDWF